MSQKKEKVDCFKEISCEIFGKVQDVGFRRFIKLRADELGVMGYVENNDDGSVSIVAQGEEEKLKEFVEVVKKGHFFSKIEDLQIAWHDVLQDGLNQFEIRE